jgi:glycosyltransferase involved in cell wall biosynthesis
MKLSVIIPSYRDPLLHKTVDSLLKNSELGNQLEIVICLDGYWPVIPLKNDPRVRVIHFGKNQGMRRAINTGIAIARGEFLMRMDEHQMIGQGYDKILTETCQPNWIVTPRRFFLDVDRWEVMDLPPVDYCKLKIQNVSGTVRKFAGVPWDRPNRKDVMIDETQAMQGSCWFMPHKWWNDVIVKHQNEGYGPHYQDSHEMVFKTWKAGGKLMVNKNTWHAHKHRSFPRTHNNGTLENPSNNEECWKYSLEQWEPYYNELQKTWTT